ncbi:NADPH:quinone oxidoreductase family protein [Salicibibacter halophilus]|uniref:NADPH:quinone oxidoreductase family protein n=1 Tax=Salicibibacter halophilus TaxID=2502791 RepID=A0A514LHF5_9BACI|nr:NADPH:quinone oxidoreductase family protein [Salicibibacter halophilus]QDI91269.1 NADPH:quinone oxidoreductase family protein [Salicibibacter halophilus]
MKAIQFSTFGGPDVLETVNVDVPKPNEQEALIEVHRVGVNYADTARRRGQYVVPTPLPFIPGAEVAGVVKEVGAGVKNVEPGTRVVTLTGSGGYAEYVAADARGLIPIGDALDLSTAAALPLQGLSAYHVLKTMGQLAEGETVLVHAAAGGVGSIAVQLAKLHGAAKVIATASTEEKLTDAKRMGADIGINYTQEGWEKEVLEATGGKGVDIALEMAGGDIFEKTLRVLGSFGRLIIFGSASGEPSKFNAMRLMEKNQSVIGFFLPQIMRKPELMQSSLETLFAHLQKGELELQIGHSFSLEDAAHVHELMEGRKTKGKIILEV